MDIKIKDVVELFGFSKRKVSASGFDCCCPFCGDKKYRLHVNTVEDVFRCARCGASGGSMTLYTLLTRGYPYNKSMREELIPEIQEKLGITGTAEQKPNVRRERFINHPSDTPIANDFRLNLVYQRLLAHPLLTLSSEHKENLLKRGLSEEAIVRNQYRTFSYKRISAEIPKELKEKYDKENWQKQKAKNEKLKALSKDKFLAYLTAGNIISDLIPDKLLYGIPGVFLFRTEAGETYKGFRFYNGLVIPIRNESTEIVRIQVRTEYAKSKYMMVSSAEFPLGSGTMRIHHPLNNTMGARKEATTAVITEGPLKADIFSENATFNAKVLALPGVSSIKNLTRELTELGIEKTLEAFDMDKLLNPAVMKAAKVMKNSIKEAGMTCTSMMWDEDGAKKKMRMIEALAEKKGIELPQNINSSIYARVAICCNCLTDKGVVVPHDWYPKTKGIDDYVVNLGEA